MDGFDFDQVVVDFYLLGLGEIYFIVVLYGCGVLSLLEYVFLLWMDDVVLQEKVDEDVEYWVQFEVE